ncbi:MAG: hypothetical protein A3G18_05165 [Rhodospirillales bacterium RIFCSPLOWO2_12_FULL_58_28]|nr:MAG: hypothetical protein A3H92_05260 [Rhodospirillales bacterium RIFCSPLOWO2_02_FULL_58_16]OHC78298.1 MAG: hypothetical protein A3G18_05165 [Rhodospirillales bacterium RIFCSPLOWO2_12_FULL_58_28]
MTIPKSAAIDDEGVWNQVLRLPPGNGNKPALFLDRDGVVLEEVNYLRAAGDARLIPGAAETIAAANRLAVPVVIITNQAGIARGYFDWEAFAAVQDKLLADLAALGAFIDGVFACPHHSMGNPPYNHPDHPARKPNPGMLLRAATMLELDLSRSWIVGDRAGDLGAGRNAGLAGGLHVLTGHGGDDGERQAAQALAGDGFIVLTADSIAKSQEELPVLQK